jgi:hypothetical protein
MSTPTSEIERLSGALTNICVLLADHAMQPPDVSLSGVLNDAVQQLSMHKENLQTLVQYNLAEAADHEPTSGAESGAADCSTVELLISLNDELDKILEAVHLFASGGSTAAPPPTGESHRQHQQTSGAPSLHDAVRGVSLGTIRLHVAFSQCNTLTDVQKCVLAHLELSADRSWREIMQVGGFPPLLRLASSPSSRKVNADAARVVCQLAVSADARGKVSLVRIHVSASAFRLRLTHLRLKYAS